MEDVLDRWRISVGRFGTRFSALAIGLSFCLVGMAPASASAAQTSTAQTSTAQTSTAQIGTAQIGTAQIGAAQTGTAQTGAAQTGAAQTGAVQTGAAQIGATQTVAAQTGPAQSGPAQSGAVQTNAIGNKVSGAFVLGSKQIPLPGGEWIVAGHGTQPFHMAKLGAFGAIETAVLFMARQDRIVAVLEVNSNTLQVNDGWGRTKACAENAKQFLLVLRYQTGWETSCLFVEATKFDSGSPGPAAWEQARQFARASKLTMAPMWLTAGFRVSDRQDLVDVRYHFDPALMLGSSAAPLVTEADWSTAAVNGDPLRHGAVQVVSAWASGFDSWVESGLRNQIRGTPGPMPEVAAIDASAPSIDAKLTELDGLYRDGRITWDAYAAQSKAATTQVPVYKAQTSLLSNSVEKNISFRSFGTFVDYGIAYIVTANTAVSWGIALTLNATDSVWFVLNDRYWDRHYAALNTHDSERIVDFTYIGGGLGS
jgi:uncharacterized membrane protein